LIAVSRHNERWRMPRGTVIDVDQSTNLFHFKRVAGLEDQLGLALFERGIPG